MATAIIRTGRATPYSAVYLLSGDNDTTVRAGTDILGDLVQGPLYDEIKKKLAASALDHLNLDGVDTGRVRIRFVTGINIGIAFPLSGFNIHWTATGLSVTMSRGETCFVEIRFMHGDVR